MNTLHDTVDVCHNKICRPLCNWFLQHCSSCFVSYVSISLVNLVVNLSDGIVNGVDIYSVVHLRLSSHQPDATPSRPHAATLYATQNENMLWSFAYD